MFLEYFSKCLLDRQYLTRCLKVERRPNLCPISFPSVKLAFNLPPSLSTKPTVKLQETHWLKQRMQLHWNLSY